MSDGRIRLKRNIFDIKEILLLKEVIVSVWIRIKCKILAVKNWFYFE